MAEDEFFRRMAEVDGGSAAVSPERRPGTAALRLAHGATKEEGRESSADADLDAGNEAQGSRSVDARSGGASRSSGRPREGWVRALAAAACVLVCVGVGAVGASLFGTGSQARELSAVPTWFDPAPPSRPVVRDRGAARRERQSPRRRRGGRDARVRAAREGRRVEAPPAPVAESGAAMAPPPEPLEGARERFGFEERTP